MPAKVDTLPIAGLLVNVYSDGSDKELHQGALVSAMFLLHGRNSSALNDKIDSFAKDLIKEAASATRELLVVTFDQRNHGTRLVDLMANEGWDKDPGKNNSKHAIDMYAIQTGTAQDVSFLIDFLPSYLYPNGEHTISDWGVMGISLGGHAAWIALRNERRLSIGIPIIGCPDYIKLMSQRAASASVPFAPPAFPDTLRRYVEAHDPVSSNYASSGQENPFWGKKILVLSGGADALVPWSCSQEFVEALQVGPSGAKQVVVQDGAGHETTPEMKSKAAKFILDWLSKPLLLE